jgi:hypothetical protein
MKVRDRNAGESREGNKLLNVYRMEDETSPLDFKTELNQFQHNKKFQKNQCRQPYFQ